MSKFTKAPWTINEWEIVGADGEVVAEMRIDARTQNANAHLIAAAPDMCEALERVLPYISGSSPEFNEVRAVVRAALKKALGEQ